MAFDNSDGESKLSTFNAAGFKMQRLHEALSALNYLDSNLTAWNEEFQEYNYKIKFHKCENLYQEVESKLNSGERENIQLLRAFITEFMDNHPVFRTLKKKVYPFATKQMINTSILKILRELLSKYETECRKLVDAHGMDTKYDNDDGL